MSETIKPTPKERMESYLRKIATGPELSKDLSLEEARDGMVTIMEGLVSDVPKAVFLIALRMKRETDEENRGVLEALRQATTSQIAPIPELIDIADPYDGFKRHLPASPFLPAVLASCGLPAISHGCEQLSPKFGVTHHQILSLAGIKIDKTPKGAAASVADPQIGWAYLDQKSFCPGLHSLIKLRELIVKRPCLSTLEKLCGPVQAQEKNHLVIGYVHGDYQRLLPLLARHAGYDSAFVIRGIEGGVSPALNSSSSGTLYLHSENNTPFTIEPTGAGIHSNVRSTPLPSETGDNIDSKNEEDTDQQKSAMYQLASASAKAGLAALKGSPGPTRDTLILTASFLLASLEKFPSMMDAANSVRHALDSGEALKRFQGGGS